MVERERSGCQLKTIPLNRANEFGPVAVRYQFTELLKEATSCGAELFEQHMLDRGIVDDGTIAEHVKLIGCRER
jgi:hypothetical protein